MKIIKILVLNLDYGGASMKRKLKDFLLTVVIVVVALSLTIFTQSQLPMLDFLTVGNSLLTWGYFLILYVFYFYVVYKGIFFYYKQAASQ